MAQCKGNLTTAIVALIVAVACIGIAAGPAASQEIGEGMSIAEGQPNVITEIARAGEIGDQRISVLDAEDVTKGDDARVVLRSADGEVQQVACLARVRDRDVREASNDQDSRYPFLKLQQPLDVELAKTDLVIQGESSFVEGQGEGIVAKSRIKTNDGDDVVLVDDISKIDPWKQIMIRSADSKNEEIRCLRALVGAAGATRDERDETAPYLTIVGEFDNDYDEGAELLQSSENAGEGVVSTLASDAADGSRRPELDSLDRVDRFSEVLIRSLDGDDQEIHCIQAVDVENNRIVLSQELGRDFGAGAEIIQGPDVARALVSGVAKDRLKGCDCCGPGGPAALWWLASLAAVPLLDDEPPAQDEPPALSPIVP